MWLLFKSFQHRVCCMNIISALEFIVSEYGGVEEIIPSGGKMEDLKQSTKQSLELPQQVSSPSKGQNMLGMMPMPKNYHHSPTQ